MHIIAKIRDLKNLFSLGLSQRLLLEALSWVDTLQKVRQNRKFIDACTSWIHDGLSGILSRLAEAPEKRSGKVIAKMLQVVPLIYSEGGFRFVLLDLLRRQFPPSLSTWPTLMDADRECDIMKNNYLVHLIEMYSRDCQAMKDALASWVVSFQATIHPMKELSEVEACLRFHFKQIIQGILVANRMQMMAISMLDLHALLEVPIKREKLKSLCHMVALMKVVEKTFHKKELDIVQSLPHIINFVQADIEHHLLLAKNKSFGGNETEFVLLYVQYGPMPRDSEPDVGWKHGRCIDGNKQKAICNYCGHRILSGGVARLKQHLVGGYSNVKDCPNCPKEVKMTMKKLLLGRIKEKREKEKREAEFNESLMDPPYRDDMVHVGDSDDDDVQYPSDRETEQQRMQHRLAVRASVADQWDADQRGRHRIGGSSGVGTSRVGGFGAGGGSSGAGSSRAGEPLLAEAGGRPSSQIAHQMGVDVDEYMTTQSQGRYIDWSSSSSEAAPPSLSGGGDRGGDDDDDGGNESAQPRGGASGGGVGSVGGGSENIEMSPFTVEQNFDHTNQDEDHASRPAPRDQTY
ncbi:hypothetical protein HHK36_028756 [Tetracentron sinense]|uniref:BED-type domain-containing protein n=1 Tax=Tetracentron sinense TaxID=13715 RepID=A0A834YGD0_TETSI|nr:hypothetical protein HHK36_028756 [Tetracentron sinense]